MPFAVIVDRELALMNALNTVFTQSKVIVCQWHVNNNVETHCKPRFTTEDTWDRFSGFWHKVMHAKTEGDFETAWNGLCSEYSEYPTMITYLERWLPYKEYFVDAWINRHLHFGNTTSSRVESGHAALKKYLCVSSGNLGRVYHNILLCVNNQRQEILAKIDSEKSRIPHRFNTPFYSEVVRKVSVCALKKIHDQGQRIDNMGPGQELPPCSGSFKSSHGLPCAHDILELRQSGQNLTMDHIHQHWWLHGSTVPVQRNSGNQQEMLQQVMEGFSARYALMPIPQQQLVLQQITNLMEAPITQIQEPVTQRTRGRPPGTSNRPESSTRRDPSAFELVEANQRRCGACGGVGHNRRTCPRNAGQ